MKNKLTFKWRVFTCFMMLLILGGCGKGENYNPYSISEESTIAEVVADNDQLSEEALQSLTTVEHTTFLLKLISQAMVIARAHPLLNGLQNNGYVETRACPDVMLTTAVGGGYPKTLTVDFAGACSPGATFDHKYTGIITLIFQADLGKDNSASSANQSNYDEFSLEITSTNLTIENEDGTKTFVITTAAPINFEFLGLSNSGIRYGLDLTGDVVVTEGMNITTYPSSVVEGRFTIINDNDDLASDPTTYVNNIVLFHNSGNDWLISGSNDGGATSVNMRFDISNNHGITLQPLSCGCPTDGTLRVMNPDIGTPLITSSEHFNFNWGASSGCTAAPNECDEFVQLTDNYNAGATTCISSSSCGTP